MTASLPVNPVDQMASMFKSMAQRIESLERAVNSAVSAAPVDGYPTGSFLTGAWATAPTGYLMMGTSVANADTAHPALWAIVPASWKSGTTLNLPSMTDRVLMGGGTLGATGGSNTASLVIANIPEHNHSIAHDHPSGTTGDENAWHTHTTSGDGAHQHTQRYLTTATGSGSNADLARPGGASFTFTDISNAGDVADGAHNHTLSNQSAFHQHAFDVAAFSGTSGNAGSNPVTPVTTTPAHLRVNVAIKT